MWDKVQPSLKAGELDLRFSKRSVLWFFTSFIAQIIAYRHCFPLWTTSIPFLGLLQTDSADSQLCQESFQTLILLCSDSLRSFSETGLCHLLPAPAASSLVLTPASVQGPEQHQLLWHKLCGGTRTQDFSEIALERLCYFSCWILC